MLTAHHHEIPVTLEKLSCIGLKLLNAETTLRKYRCIVIDNDEDSGK